MKKSNKSIGLKDIIANEKAIMLPLNFTTSYIVTPIYLVVTLLLLVGFGVSIETDNKSYIIFGYVCLGIFALLSIALLATVPFVRKRAIKTELTRYDFDASDEEYSENFEFYNSCVRFDKQGMYVNDNLFYYNHLRKRVVTNNKYQRVLIFLQFSAAEHEVLLPLNPETINMLTCLNIKLENQHILDYIINNKEKAFQQIYDKKMLIL
ncbi:MAG: hypothetical protein J6Q83_02475 [Clostridia bacterium]|nr:hypothetical protein [Clostridia bacterium]